jgi:hypothetical protein
MLSVNFFCNISSYDILAYITKNYIALIYYAKIVHLLCQFHAGKLGFSAVCQAIYIAGPRARGRIQIVNKLAPVCLHDLVNVKNSKYAFRYSNILDVPQVRTTRYGKKSFMFAAATLWNDLLNHFRTENSFNHFKNLIQSWNGSVCRCSACR